MENGQPTNRVIKVLGNNITFEQFTGLPLPSNTPALLGNVGGDSLLAQFKGSVVLQRLGIPTPKISYMHAAQRTKEFSFAIMDRVNVDAPNVDVWDSTKFPMPEKRAAVIALHQRLAGAGYVPADLAPRNVYFVLQNGVVRAGVWDADLIMKLPMNADLATEVRFKGILGGAAAGNNLGAQDRSALFNRIDFHGDARQAIELIQEIQWGKLH
jgi:hypothetical protein